MDDFDGINPSTVSGNDSFATVTSEMSLELGF